MASNVNSRQHINQQARTYQQQAETAAVAFCVQPNQANELEILMTHTLFGDLPAAGKDSGGRILYLTEIR